MKFKFLLLVFFSTIFVSKTFSQAYTWTENVACILYTNCTSCHNPGGIGGFSLLTYTDAVSWASEIRTQVASGHMPPWPPDRGYARHAYERYLTYDEKNIILDWCDNGVPEGPAGAAPTPPTYSSNSELASINYTEKIGVYNNITNIDDYRCMVINPGFTTDKYVNGIEIIPGNRAMVHHVLVYIDNSSTINTLDAADPELGYQSFGGTGSASSKLIGAWAPGAKPTELPDGMALKIPAGYKIILQMHYAPGTLAQTDSTRINLQFDTGFGGTDREANFDGILNHYTNIDAPLAIPPNSVRTFNESYTLPSVFPSLIDNFTFLGVGPHMHKIGKSIRVWAEKPGGEIVPMIDIPDWDFHWQGIYQFRQPIVLPEGTILRSTATFDNTVANLDHFGNLEATEHDSWVYAGENTNEEMMITFFTWVFSPAGYNDASIIIDTTTVKETYDGCIVGTFVGLEEENNNLLKVYPNPAKYIVTTNFTQIEEGDLMIEIFDVSGKVIFNLFQPNVPSGEFVRDINIEQISNGNYIIKIKSGRNISHQKLIVIK